MAEGKLLDTPIVIKNPWGDVTLTHSITEFSFHPGTRHVRTKIIFGVVTQGGKFKAYTKQDEIQFENKEIYITGVKFEKLMEARGGKPEGIFRTTDVEDIIQEIKTETPLPKGGLK